MHHGNQWLDGNTVHMSSLRERTSNVSGGLSLLVSWSFNPTTTSEPLSLEHALLHEQK